MSKECKEIKQEKIRKVFLENLPRSKSGKTTNWLKSIGYKVRFIYDDIEGIIKIVDYKDGFLYIKYEDKEPFKISISNFKNCALGKLLGKVTNELKIEIGTTFKDENRDITIIDREYRIRYYNNGYTTKEKWYKYKCNKCGFECGEHYKDGKYKEELWISEYNLLNGGNGCACCRLNPQIVVPNINSIVANEETYWMIQYFQGGYDEAKMYTPRSGQKIKPVCPDCGRIKDNKMTIDAIYKHKSIRCTCKDGIKYPEKFIFNLLEQVGLEFKTQLSKTTFDWCENKRYDFYFELNKEKYIIETHGKQHYEQAGYKWKTVKEEQKNDKFKKELAIENGIKEENYIVINCRESDMEWIKKDVLKSELNNLFDLSKIDWNKCEEFALSNRVKEACEIKRNNPEMTASQIGEIIGVGEGCIRSYFKKGNNIWEWCNYNAKEEQLKASSKNGKSSGKKIEIFKDGISLGVFESVAELERQSEDIFGVKLFHPNISNVCNALVKQYKGYTFKYI